MNFINFILENWYLIVGAFVIIGAATYFCIKFFKMPRKEQLQKVREWLLMAVIEAEKIFGSGTGKVKLRYVYDLFVSRFTWLVKIVPFETFSNLVDDALVEMRELLANNQAIASLVNEE